MKVCYPDYYADFSCLAGECRHSCCRGWEIDIDEQSLRRYRRVKGPLGKELKKYIQVDETAHFILGEDERCPFLREDGLCRLYIELGEGSLCDICAEHPRFYNEYEGFYDAGLGACCEAVAHLIVSGNEPTRLLWEDDGAASGEEPPMLQLRAHVLEVLASSGSLRERMERALALVGVRTRAIDLSREAAFFLTLERMDDAWTQRLESLRDVPNAVSEERLGEMRFERIAEYFIYRNFAAARTMEEAALRLRFAFLSTMLICAMGEDTEEILRLYSAEIEYSDENVACILRHLAEAEDTL